MRLPMLPPVLALLTGLLGCQARAPAPAAPAATPQGLRLVSSNIRYANPADGQNAWPRRRAVWAGEIRALHPDLLALQEALPSQLADIRADLPDYEALAFNRQPGKPVEEHMVLLVRRGRLRVESSGCFWLSPTPEVAGSRGWDAALPRICAWARVAEVGGAAAPAWLVACVHLDHVGATARMESARLLLHRLPALAAGTRGILVMGDFNAAPDGPVHAAWDAGGWRDAWAATHPDDPAGPGTFHGFTPAARARIDWILGSPGLRFRAAGVGAVLRDGRHPSDHCAVWADVE